MEDGADAKQPNADAKQAQPCMLYMTFFCGYFCKKNVKKRKEDEISLWERGKKCNFVWIFDDENNENEIFFCYSGSADMLAVPR